MFGNFDKDSSFQRKSLILLQWTICAKYNVDIISVLMRDQDGIIEVNKHLPIHADTQKF